MRIAPKVLRWVGIGLGGLLGVVVIAAVVLYVLGGSRLNKTHDIQVEAVAVPTDEEAIARGRHFAEAVTVCQGCHGDNLEGDLLFGVTGIASVYASNLTSGQGGIGVTYSDTDYVRAIRHGVNPEGRGLMIMHSDIFHNISEEDLGAIIAYIKSVPPVDNEIPGSSVAPLGRILVALGLFDDEALPLIPAEVIDHDAPFTRMPAQGATPEYGQYLMSITLCNMCHGSDLKGGRSSDPELLGPNIVSLSAPGR